MTVLDDVTVRVTDRNAAEQLPDLRWQLYDAVMAGAVRVIVDLSEVRQLSSTVLATLLCVHRRCRARGGCLVIVGGSREVLDLLYRNGLHHVFTVQDRRHRRRRDVAPALGPS